MNNTHAVAQRTKRCPNTTRRSSAHTSTNMTVTAHVRCLCDYNWDSRMNEERIQRTGWWIVGPSERKVLNFIVITRFVSAEVRE